jgi:peptidyl-prolyl cis-trans isomerase C
MIKVVRVCSIFLILCLGCLSTAAEKSDVDIVARVNGTAITRKDLEEKINAAVNRTYFHKKLPAEKERQIKKQSLAVLIEEELLYQQAREQEISVDKNEVDRRYQNIVGQFPAKADFKQALERIGYRPKEFRKKIEREFLIQEVYKRNITDQVVLTEAALKDYYEKNKYKFKKPETVNLQLIFIKISDPTSPDSRQEARKRAEDILDRLKGGENFDDLASRYSDDMYRIKGGRLGEVHKGRLPKEIEEAAFSMKIGQISPLIQTTTGCSIIKVLDKSASRQLEFAEIEGKLKKELEKKRLAEVRKKWLGRLKAEAQIEIYIDFP